MNFRRPQRQRLKIDPALVIRFRPPVPETLLINLLRSLQVLCLLGTSVALIDYFGPNRWPEAVWLPVAIFGAHALGFYRGLWLEENLRTNDFFLILAELLTILVGMRLIALLLGFTDNFVSSIFLVDYAFVAVAWQMGRTWSHPYLYLYVRPQELTEAQGGATGVTENSTLFYDHRAAYQSVKTSWYWQAGLQAALVIGGVVAASQYKGNWTGADLSQSLLVFGALHLILGLPLLAWARLRYLRTVWRLNRLEPPSRLSTRWAFYLSGLLLVALLPALALATLNPANGVQLPNIDIRGSQSTAEPINRGTIAARPTPITPFNQSQSNRGEPFQIPAWVQTVLLFGMIAGVACLVVWLLLRSGWVGPRWRKFNLPRTWRNVVTWLRSLFGPRRPRETFEKADRDRVGRSFNPFGRFQRDRLPNDPRGRVRFQYRRVIERATRAGLPRSTGQTPGEYARYLTPSLEEDPQLGPQLDDLTGLYEEARFSPHPIETAQATLAQQHSDSLTAHFRHKSRRARLPQPMLDKPTPPESKSN